MTGLTGVALGLRLAGESMNDPTLGLMYGDRSLSGELVASGDLPYGLRVSGMVGYRRTGGHQLDADGQLSSSTSWIRYVPVSATVGLHRAFSRVDLGLGVGPATVGFSEQVGEGDPETSRGWKWGALLEGDARVQLGQLQATDTAFAVDVSLGYRAMLRRHGEVCGDEAVCGLDLSAVRIGLGAVVML